jgi:ATP-binding cassette subfamily C protein
MLSLKVCAKQYLILGAKYCIYLLRKFRLKLIQDDKQIRIIKYKTDMKKIYKKIVGIWSVLNKNEKRKSIYLIITMAIVSLMEISGVTILLPIVALLQGASDPTAIKITRALTQVGVDPQSAIAWMMVIIVCLYGLKTIANITYNKLMLGYIAEIQSTVSTRLFGNYLRRPYTYHREINTSQIIRNTTTEVSNFVHLTVVPILALITESTLLVLMGILLVTIDPITAIAVVVIGIGSVAAYQFAVKEMHTTNGKIIQDSGGMATQMVQEGLGGIKDTILSGRASFFETKFEKYIKEYTEAISSSAFYTAIPRTLLENIFIILLVAVIAIYQATNRISEVVPLLALYVGAAFRLIPGIGRISNSLGQISMGSASFEIVCSELALKVGNPNTIRQSKLELTSAIRIENVCYGYGNKSNLVLNYINAKIVKGSLVGISGMSGSGKTTLIDLLLGLLEPTHGEIYIDEISLKVCKERWQATVTYVPQNIYLLDGTIEENIALGIDIQDINKNRLQRAIEMAQLTEFNQVLKDNNRTRLGERGQMISGGQRQRIGIARALYTESKVIVLDEATSALDADTEDELMETLIQLKTENTIIMVTHSQRCLDKCDYIIEL